jgi:hypothetical protein
MSKMSKKSSVNSGVKTPGDSLAVKRSQFVQQSTESQKKGSSARLVAVPLIVVALVAGIFLFAQQQGAGTPAAQAQTAAAPASEVQGNVGGLSSQAANKKYPLVLADASGELKFPVASLADGKARFFSATLPDGKPINFFLVKSSDGVIRAAIDACDVCFAARKGYHQEGDFLVCNNCGQRFPSVKINEVKGGCNPAPLTRAMQGDTVVIKLSDLQKDNRSETGQPLF